MPEYHPTSAKPAKSQQSRFQITSQSTPSALLQLFRATAALLATAPNPKFVAVSSGAGSIGEMELLKDVQNTAYGAQMRAQSRREEDPLREPASDRFLGQSGLAPD